jgi:hypothetical protein
MQLPAMVNDDEPLARYLTHSDYYNVSTDSVKPKAFEPLSRDLCLSIFRIDDLNIKQVLQLGQDEVINKTRQPLTLYGFADIKAKSVTDLNLSIEPDNIPPRHACIVGWPEEKFQRKSIAQQLAASSKLVLNS